MAQPAVCLRTCFQFSPPLVSSARLLGGMLSPHFFHLSPHFFSHALAGLDAVTRSGLGCSSACWAGFCLEMVWLGQLLVSPLASSCLSTCFSRVCHWMLGLPVARLLSHACWPWLAWLSLSPRLFPHALAGLDAVRRWSGSVSSLSPLASIVSPLVLARACSAGGSCLHLSPRLFRRALAGLNAVTRRYGLFIPLLPHLLPVVSPHVSSRACWAGCCHEIIRLLCFPTFCVSPFVFKLAAEKGTMVMGQLRRSHMVVVNDFRSIGGRFCGAGHK